MSEKKGIREYNAFQAMKQNLPSNSRISREVKQEMTTLLNRVVKTICENMTGDYVEIRSNDFYNAAKPFIEIIDHTGKSKELDMKHITYIDKIISDCETMKNEINAKWSR